MKLNHFFILILVGFSLFGCVENESLDEDLQFEKRQIQIDDVVLTVDIADTPEKRERGLMFREGLAGHEGMLFIFENADHYAIWMMNMQFSIDILWLDEEGTIVHVVKNAAPCADDIKACTYRPEGAAKYVLEVPAGFVEKYGIMKNSQVSFI